MASYKIETNKKGELVGRIYVASRDIKTGERKNITKRIYNEKNLTEPKFQKLVEKESVLFEDEVLSSYKEQKEFNSNRVLTFAELGKEFVENTRKNYSINYYMKAKDTVIRFNKYLESNNLQKEPLDKIRVRDIQLYLNSYQSYDKIKPQMVVLKRVLPANINFRLLEREKIIDRCRCYDLRKNKRRISKARAIKICEKCNLEYSQYFEEVDGDKRFYSVETIKGHRRVLRTIFNEALRYEWITKNPVCQTKIGAGGGNTSLRPVHEKEVFSIQEAKEFLTKADMISEDLIYKKIPFKFMILTGVRAAEMCGLRWGDINFDKKIVHIARSRQHCKEFGTYEKEPKTRTSIRDIPLPDALIQDLEHYKEWFRLADENFDSKLDKFYIAVNMYREPINRDSLGKWLDDFELRNGLKHVPCHGLRHTYCSLLLSQNVPIQTVSKYMGHSDSTITLKVYSHFIPDTQEKVVSALNNLLKN